MASTGPDERRVPSGDGFPEGADIIFKRRVCGYTADNLFIQVQQSRTATNHTRYFALEPLSQSRYTVTTGPKLQGSTRH